MKTARWIILVVLVLAIAAIAVLCWQLVVRYQTHILPGVTIAGINVGDMTTSAAYTTLRESLPSLDMRTLTVSVDDDISYTLTWTDAGIDYILDPPIQAALAVSQTVSGWDILQIALGLDELRADFDVDVTAPDKALVAEHAHTLREQVATPPQDAQLDWQRTALVPIYGVAGRRLNLEYTHAAMLVMLENAIAQDQTAVSLHIDSIPITPDMPEPEPAYYRAQRLLDVPLTLSIFDPIRIGEETEPYSMTFTAEPELIYTWLYAETVSPQIHLRYNQDAVRTWVESIAAQMPEGRHLDVDDTTVRIITGPMQTASHHIDIRVSHMPTTYTVEPGDVFYDIAFNFGLPQYQLEKANPDVEPGQIDIGQVLNVPSMDVLFPYPHVQEKRIDIYLSKQYLVAFENDFPVYTLTVSSGISTTPTLSGQFQVLFKEEDAYARRWRLDMPYFMGFYEEGPGFYNGFHELPITAWGTRLRASVLGYPASFGCIILGEGDAETLFNWTEVGTYVEVIGYAPGTPFGRTTLADLTPLEGDE